MMNWQEPSTWSVLVVDDEPDNLELVVEVLQFFGVSVKSAKDGVAALQELETFTPTLILLDLSMPKMSGWELRARIKSNPKLSPIPVIALTAHAMVGDSARVQAAGFDGYMTKPINIPTLVDDIRKAVLHNPAAKSAIVATQPTANGPILPNAPLVTSPAASPEPRTNATVVPGCQITSSALVPGQRV